jgi:nucleoside 2-deoxyribosyltransferase
VNSPRPSSNLPSVYIAGPDLFFDEYEHFMEEITRICADIGLTPVFPADAPGKSSVEIFRGNIERIRSSEALVANLEPFRSYTEPDSGTAFEVGYAEALGKPIGLWIPANENIPHRARVERNIGVRAGKDGRPVCLWGGCLVEDFDSPVNLMLGNVARVFSSPLEALLDIACKLREAQWGPE